MKLELSSHSKLQNSNSDSTATDPLVVHKAMAALHRFMKIPSEGKSATQDTTPNPVTSTEPDKTTVGTNATQAAATLAAYMGEKGIDSVNLKDLRELANDPATPAAAQVRQQSANFPVSGEASSL